MTNEQTNKKQKIVYPTDIGERISEIVKRHGLASTEDLIEKMMQAKTEEEYNNIKESIPARQIAILIREVAENEILAEEVDSVLAQDLEIPIEKAKEITQDLEKEVFSLLKKSEEAEEEKPNTEESPYEKTAERGPDSYREPIE